MALARCILGKFLGVVCRCFPLPLDVPTFAARCLHVLNNASAHSSEWWNCGREWCPVIYRNYAFSTPFRDLLHAVKLRHGTDGFTFPPKEGMLRIFSTEKSDGFGRVWTRELGYQCMLTTRPPKPLVDGLRLHNNRVRLYRTIILHFVLYGCETWSLTLMGERRLRVFENRVLRRAFGP
jgi:hypothetical protein